MMLIASLKLNFPCGTCAFLETFYYKLRLCRFITCQIGCIKQSCNSKSKTLKTINKKRNGYECCITAFLFVYFIRF